MLLYVCWRLSRARQWRFCLSPPRYVYHKHSRAIQCLIFNTYNIRNVFDISKLFFVVLSPRLERGTVPVSGEYSNQLSYDRILHRWQDSNLQHSVLETDALPLSYTYVSTDTWNRTTLCSLWENCSTIELYRYCILGRTRTFNLLVRSETL